MKLWHYNNRYISVDVVKCGFCYNQIDRLCILYEYWGKNHSGNHIICPNCSKNLNKKASTGIVIECKTVTIVDEIPAGAVPVITRPPTLKTCKAETVFSAACLDSEQTIDRTRWTGRPEAMIEGVTIGKSVIDGTRDSPLETLEDVNKRLLEHKPSKRKEVIVDD